MSYNRSLSLTKQSMEDRLCASSSDDYQSIIDLLNTWKTPQFIQKRFVDLKLTIWHLENITESDVSDLFRSNELIEKLEFLRSLRKWKSARVLLSADPELCNLLKSWGMNEKVCAEFIRLKLTIWHLKILDDCDINELFPYDRISERIQFKYYLKKWRSDLDNNSSYDSADRWETISSSSSCSLTLNSDRTLTMSLQCIDQNHLCVNNNNNCLKLDDILNRDVQGRNIKQFFKENGRLREIHRSKLIDIIFDNHFKEYECAMSLTQIEDYANQIQDIFPTENKNTYYQPRIKSFSPKGKLFDKQNNHISDLKNKSTTANTTSTPTTASCNSTTAHMVKEEEIMM